MSERVDLDGQRLMQPGKPEVWLMFHGRRHHIENAEVYQNLFGDLNITSFEDIELIEPGPALNDGTCLVSGDVNPGIFLVTGEGVSIRRYHIATYESFLHFGFDEGRVKKVPSIVLNGVVAARPITSAVDRASRLTQFRA